MNPVKNPKQETNVTLTHKHTEPSRNMVQKCKKQCTIKWKNKNIKTNMSKNQVEGPFGILKEQFQ
jgi:hypothetical protein